jgi:pimeloyl-ACP methyl ester carboxylesterase
MIRTLLVLMLASTAVFAKSEDLSGDWTGELNTGSASIHLILHLKGDGGTWESVEQHGTIPIQKIEVHERTVLIDAGFAKFTGTLDASGQSMAGTFRQGSGELPLSFRKGGPVARAARRSQEPQRPFPYTEEVVAYPGGGAVVLAGTLTCPKSGGPFPAALLISGSGAQDRDETIFGHKPFLVLSDWLTRMGFAVLRVDDRGTGKSQGVFEKATYDDKVADVLAGIAFLKMHKNVDAAMVGLIGHSEGGSIGPLAATRSDVAFVVMLAGMGVPGEQVLRQQGIDVARSAGASEALITKQVETQSRMFAIVRGTPDRATAEAQLRELLGSGAAADQQIHAVYSPTFQDLLRFDPGPVLRRLACPVLAANGAHDRQVSAAHNLPAIAKALAESKSQDWAVVELPGLNHLFQTSKTGGIAEYAAIDETMAPSALKAIGDWLSGRFPRK